MAVEIVGATIDVDLECTDCGHQWQETFYEEHTRNAFDKASDECPACPDDDGYVDREDCVEHLTSCDSDGYCNYCGHDE